VPTFPAGASFPHSGYVSVRCVGCSGGYILNRRGNQAAVAGSVTDSITAKAPDQRRDCRINAHPPDEIAVFLLLFCCHSAIQPKIHTTRGNSSTIKQQHKTTTSTKSSYTITNKVFTQPSNQPEFCFLKTKNSR